ncbi:MAG: VCBS repeat-containing protein [Sphingobacteriales bacterium]|nr:VCBS repeat-containing protein [Sphingobacteriales bacterium]
MKILNFFLICFSFFSYCTLAFAQSTTFSTEQIIVGSTASGAIGVDPADLDNDGDMDIVSASTDDNIVAWYKNNGSGNFGTQQIITTTANKLNDIHSADLDSDGDIDVLSAGDKILWYENDGNGNFSDPKIIKIGGNTKSIYTADLDNDGDIDVLSIGNVTAWYKNDGNQISNLYK